MKKNRPTRGLRDTLGSILKVVTFLWKILPVIIDAINDLKDDGIINGSSSANRKRDNEINESAS